MKNTPKLQRQSLGCGYEPRTDRVHLQVWQPPGGDKGYQGEPLTVCAGYTANLPEVLETSLLRVHWGKGNVDALAIGEDMFNALIVLEGSYNQVQAWLMTPAKDGGGGR